MTLAQRLPTILGKKQPSWRPCSSSSKPPCEPEPKPVCVLRTLWNQPDQLQKLQLKAYKHLLPHGMTSNFADNAQLAARGAVFLYLAGLPLVFGFPHYIPFFEHNHLFNTSAIVMYVFTLYKSVGETISFAIGGMVGTLLAAVAAELLFWPYQAGVTTSGNSAPVSLHDGEVVWGVLLGLTSVVFTLGLNFSTLAQIFMLSNYAYFWMDYMNPEKDKPSSILFGYSFHVVGVNALADSLCGCSLALLAVLLPYPILAINRAREISRNTVTIFGETWSTAITMYCSHKNNRQLQAKMRHDMDKAQLYISSLKSHITNSWWEAFFYPPLRNVKQLLTSLDTAATQNIDCLTHVISSCTREDFNNTHAQLMSACKQPLQCLTSSAQELLVFGTEMACAGGARSKVEEEKLEAGIKQVEKDTLTLTQKFRAVKAELNLQEVQIDLLDEHVFLYSACSYSRIVSDFARSLAAEDAGTDQPSCLKELLCSWTVFDRRVLFDYKHLNFALRNSLTILICLTIGYLGYSQMIGQYAAEIAGTAGVLISKFVGSSMTANLNRLQAVALGVVIGQLLYALFGWCSPWAWSLMSVLILSWSGLTLYIYFNSRVYSGMGCLLAAFGSQQLLQGCSSKVVEPEVSFTKIINCVIAIIVMTLVDQLLSTGLPSAQACSTYLHAWKDLQEAARGIFSSDEPEYIFERGGVVEDISTATLLAKEAALEPRNWRLPWPDSTFRQAIKCIQEVRLNVSCIQIVGAPNSTKDDWFLGILENSYFKDAVEAVMEKMSLIERLMTTVQEEQKDDVLNAALMDDSWERAQLAINNMLIGWNTANLSMVEPASLELDRAAQASFMLSCICSLMLSMQELEDIVLSQ